MADRLSSLPDPLIHLIVSCLPIKEMVRTCLLSRRWLNVWSSAAYLNFDCYEVDAPFVNKYLDGYSAQTVEKFRLSLHSEWTSLLESCIQFAISHNVKDLEFDYYGFVHDDTAKLPLSLYMCSSLVKLDTNLCVGRVSSPISWPLLKFLSINCSGLRNCDIQQILAGSLRLQFLKLIRSSPHISVLEVNSTHMRELVIDGCYNCDDSGLEITAPKLRVLRVLDSAQTVILKDVSSVEEAELDVKNVSCNVYYDEEFDRKQNHREKLRNNLHILEKLAVATKITIGKAFLKDLGNSLYGNEEIEFPLAEWKNLTIVMDFTPRKSAAVAKLLMCAWHLEHLTIKISEYKEDEEYGFKNFWSSRRNIFPHLSKCLKRVDLIDVNINSIYWDDMVNMIANFDAETIQPHWSSGTTKLFKKLSSAPPCLRYNLYG